MSNKKRLSTNQFGLDAGYFHEKLSLIVRDVGNMTPDGMSKALARLSAVAGDEIEALKELSFDKGKDVGKEEYKKYLRDFVLKSELEEGESSE